MEDQGTLPPTVPCASPGAVPSRFLYSGPEVVSEAVSRVLRAAKRVTSPEEPSGTLLGYAGHQALGQASDVRPCGGTEP